MAEAVYHKVFSKEARVQIPKNAIYVFLVEIVVLGQVFLSVLRSYVVRVPPVLLPILAIVTDAV